MLLSIDPGTNQFGLALFDIKSRSLVESWTLCAPAKGTTVQRMVSVQSLVSRVVGDKPITQVAVEFYPKSQIPFIAIGAVLAGLTSAKAQINKASLVTPSAWKSYVKKNAAPGYIIPDVIKGIPALACLGMNLAADSDDEADAILVGLTWMSKILKINVR
jgi:Holliday junction resolvasome RuvABC endonuclease subunit